MKKHHIGVALIALDIRIAQLKLAEFEAATGGFAAPPADDVRRFRLDELIGVEPAACWARQLTKPRSRKKTPTPDSRAMTSSPTPIQMSWWYTIVKILLLVCKRRITQPIPLVMTLLLTNTLL